MDTQALETLAPAGPPSAAHKLMPGTKADPKPKQIGRKLKIALDCMVYGDENGEPCEWDDAARKAGLSLVAMRKALERAHVLRYSREQKQVFRQSVSAANILHARRIRNASGNAMASLGAIKLLEQMDERAPAHSGAQKNVTPGVVVVINNDRATPLIDHQTVIEINPLQSQEDVGHGD
jgi:hypothetical protein